MYDQKYAELMEERRKFDTENFIQGHHKYWILKRKKESIIYCDDIEIYKYDQKQHNAFLQVLSLFTYKFHKLEIELNNYYINASSPSYNFYASQKHLINMEKFLQKIHIFFQNSDNALIYIRRVLYEHFCKMVEHRFLTYLENNIKKEIAISYQDLENFRAEDRKLLNNLFLPIYHLLINKAAVKTTKSIEKSTKALNHLWGYFNYISYCPNALDETVTEDDLKKYRRQDYIDWINKKISNLSILHHLKIMADVFTDYFSIFSHLQEYYPNTEIFHQYMLLLSNNHFYTNLINSCTYYSAHQSMYKLIRDYIIKTNPHHIAIMSQVAKDYTDDIYQHIKDSIDTDSDSKNEITKALLQYYPKEFEHNKGAEIIEFQFFEQFIAIELLDIIEQNLIIQKCIYCDAYFITNSKKQKYCDQHKNNPIIQQRNHSKNKNIKSDYQLTFKRYDGCFNKRIKRKGILEKNYMNWKKDALELLTESESKNISKDEFIDKLNFLSKKNNFNPPRDYKTAPKKK